MYKRRFYVSQSQSQHGIYIKKGYKYTCFNLTPYSRPWSGLLVIIMPNNSASISNDTQCGDNSSRSVVPECIDRSMADLLITILHQTIECVNSESWELRRMSQQVSNIDYMLDVTLSSSEGCQRDVAM